MDTRLASPSSSSSSSPLNSRSTSKDAVTDLHLLAATAKDPTEVKSSSWLACFSNIANTILGAGALGIPFAFSNSGYILGTFMLLIAGYFSATGLHLLSKCAAKVNPRVLKTDEDGAQKFIVKSPSSFYSLANAVSPKLCLVIDVVVAIKCFGVMTSYLIVLGDLMPKACAQLGGNAASQNRTLWVVIGWIIAAPFNCLHNLDGLKFTSALCIFSVIFVTFIIFLYALDIPSLDPCDNQSLDDDDAPCVGSVGTEVKAINFLQVLSIYVFSYTCQQNVFPVVNEYLMELPPASSTQGVSSSSSSSSSPLDDRIRAAQKTFQDGLNSVFITSIIAAFCLYMVIGMSGYSTFGDSIHSDALQNYPKTSLLSVCRLMLSFVVVFSYPLQCNPARRCIMTLISGIFDKDTLGLGFNKPEAAKTSTSTESTTTCPIATHATAKTPVGEGVSSGKEEKEESSDSNSILEGEEPSEPSARIQLIRYCLVTVGLLVCSLILAMSLDNLGVMLELVGATASTSVSYILPGFLYLYIHKDDDGGRAECSISLGSMNKSESVTNGSIESPSVTDASNPIHRDTPKVGDENDSLNLLTSSSQRQPWNLFSPWPTDVKTLKIIAAVQLACGVVIMPLCLGIIFATEL